MTPRLEDPSWYSSEWQQREYNDRIETTDTSSILYFINETAINETYTWPRYAGWDLIWPFAVLNYTELAAEWHIRVLQGNVTVHSLFTISRGSASQSIRGSYVPNSSSEMNATAPDEITLVSIASNFTEQFSIIDVGILWVDLDILAAQGSIVAVDNVEVWISTEEPLCQVTLDFQTLYGQSLFSNPTIVSQWLGTEGIYGYHNIGQELTFYLRSFTKSSPYGSNYMLATGSNQTAYLLPGNYSLALGWTDTYSHNVYVFNMTLHENFSFLMNIPLPFNQVKVEVNNSQIPGNIGVNYLDRVNITKAEDFLFIIPECDTFSIRFSIPGYGGKILEIETTEGIWSEVVIDLKLVPLIGILLTHQQITGMVTTFVFAVLSLAILLNRWHSSKKTSYLKLIPLLLFCASLVLPWYTCTQVYSTIEYTTYVSPILGYRFWSFNGLFLTSDSLFYSERYLMLLMPILYVLLLIVILTACLFESKPIDFLFTLSVTILVLGGITLFASNGLPSLGLWIMLLVPPLSYIIERRTVKEIEEPSQTGISEHQSN